MREEKTINTKIGEHEIIQIIQKNLTLPNMPVPFGDDVSAVSIDRKTVAVLKTDMLVGKTDVPKQMSLYQAARKAIVMNVSDFAAKGVQPSAALVALGVPRKFTQEDVKEVACGLDAGAQEYSVYVIGGDTNEASDLIVSVSMFGIAEKSKLMLRNGAEKGDVLAVTGFFGKPSAGLRLLQHKNCRIQESSREALLKSVFSPKARLAEGIALSKCGNVTAAIDSSDGLAWSLHELARLSKVGFEIDNSPTAKEASEFAQTNRTEASDLVLYGGEEYEIVVTVKPQGWNAAKTAVEAVGGQLLPIGKTTNKPGVFLNDGNKIQVVEARGWEHFKSKI
jgi:thiamine-monophosphate kinase